MKHVTGQVMTDESGYTFLTAPPEIPYWVVDEAEANHLGDVPTPDPGDRVDVRIEWMDERDSVSLKAL